MIKKWQRRRVCYSKYYATTVQDEEDTTVKKSAKKSHTSEATTSNGKIKVPWKDPPAGNQNPVVRNKRKSPNNKTPLIQNERRKQVILKYTLWQRPTLRTSSLQSPTPTGTRSQPKWGPLNQVSMRKAWSINICGKCNRTTGIHCTSITYITFVCNMYENKGLGLQSTVIDPIYSSPLCDSSY